MNQDSTKNTQVSTDVSYQVDCTINIIVFHKTLKASWHVGKFTLPSHIVTLTILQIPLD